jgi:hypothetical protein
LVVDDHGLVALPALQDPGFDVLYPGDVYVLNADAGAQRFETDQVAALLLAGPLGKQREWGNSANTSP